MMDEQRLKDLAETCRALLPGVTLVPGTNGLQLATPMMYLAVEEHGRRAEMVSLHSRLGVLLGVSDG